MLASAQEFLHGRLQSQVDRNWRHLLAKVREQRLVIEIRVDERGNLTLARLVNSSGSLTLDRLIDEWLKDSKLSLPPITPNIIYPFLITLHRS
jgi:outer membrane biosynthesis protein TonB